MSSPNPKILRLGTRRSLLAMAQSASVARNIEEKNPGLKIELIGIETRGDKIQDIALQKIEGKDFFVAELDAALLRSEVDFTVHSMKDLSLERPASITTAAVPKRENARDIVIFNAAIIDKLNLGKQIVIGTSSPRRLENIPPFLKRVMPVSEGGHSPSLLFCEIRGNVNTRLSRLQKDMDGVVLAVAGLLRLMQDEVASVELEKLLKNTKFMLLPLKENPTAPAQGALSVECRTDDASTIAMLSKIHHPYSKEESAAERKILEEWGGGCHQRFGATQILHKTLGPLLYIAGKKSDGSDVCKLKWNPPQRYELLKNHKSIWDGHEYRSAFEGKTDDCEIEINASDIVYVSHSRAVSKNTSSKLKNRTVFVAGTKSWEKLAKQGVWVSGSSEEICTNELFDFIENQFFRHSGTVHVLTHATALNSWEPLKSEYKNLNFKLTPTYSVEEVAYSDEVKTGLSRSKIAFFSSASQFEKLREYVSTDTLLCTGAGKSSDRLTELGVDHYPFPSRESFINWIRS